MNKKMMKSTFRILKLQIVEWTVFSKELEEILSKCIQSYEQQYNADILKLITKQQVRNLEIMWKNWFQKCLPQDFLRSKHPIDEINM